MKIPICGGVSEGLWHPHEVCKRSLPSMTRACSLGQVDGVNDGVALGDTRVHSYRLDPLGIPQEFLCKNDLNVPRSSSSAAVLAVCMRRQPLRRRRWTCGACTLHNIT